MPAGKKKQKNDNNIIIKQKEQIIINLLGIFFYLVIILGAFSVIASILRFLQIGWHYVYVIHISVFLIAFFILLFRKRLPLVLVIGVIILTGVIASVFNLIIFGFMSLGIFMLGIMCIIAGILTNFRRTLFTLLISLIIIITIGTLYCTGYLKIKYDPYSYLVSPASWITQASLYIFLVVLVILLNHSIQKSLNDSFYEQKRQSDSLKEKNLLLNREIAERKKAEAEAKKNEEKYRLLADNTDDVIFIQDLEFNIIYANPSTGKLFGYTDSEILSLKMEDYLVPDSLKKVKMFFHEHYQLVQKQDILLPLMEFEYKKKDGTIFHGELRATFMKDSSGTITSVLGILRDISERKKLEIERNILKKQIMQIEKMNALGQLSSGIAHDFNNLLNIILLHTEITLNSLHKSHENIKNLKYVMTACERSKTLIKQILTFTRQESVTKDHIHLSSIIDESLAFIREMLPSSIKIITNNNCGDSSVLGDATQIQQIIINLCTNAAYAMGKKGTLKISSICRIIKNEIQDMFDTITPGEYVILSISDTGCGMDKKTIEHIFEPFYTTKTKTEGTGMGLAVVLGIIKNHAGHIVVKSNPGEGSEFTIYLPAVKADKLLAEKTGKDPQSSYGHEKILIIDDEELLLNGVKAMLAFSGFKVVGCSSPIKALEMLKSSEANFDVVITDQTMPEMMGIELAEKIREFDPDMPIILSSGYLSETEERIIKDLKIDFILNKPYTKKSLVDAIHHVVR